jgi:hypothetical protein
MNASDNKGLFSEVFRKKDYRYKSWVAKADFQLRFKTKNLIVRYSTGEDIILDIVTGVLCGNIHWDPEKVELGTFMHHQIRSHISNLLRKELNKLTPTVSEYDKVFPKYVDTGNLVSESLGEILYNQDLKEIRETISNYLEENDVIAFFVFEEIIKGSKNQDIAETLGITDKDVVNVKRRIDHALKRIISEKK